jgi:8-oxo-dGTP pyrophosphatase MutT (NUDIX family)
VAKRDGQQVVMLITSRETRRWVIPKGWAKAGVAPHAQAAREAFEEAGLEGEIGTKPIATYHYEKRLPEGRTRPCEVQVFALAVTRQLDDWPEKSERETRWFTPAEAAQHVSDEGLARLMRKLAAEAPESSNHPTDERLPAKLAPALAS